MADNQSMIAGLFTTPQEYQQQQQAQNLALGAQMAQLSPSQQGIANIYAGDAQANGSDSRKINRYGMDLRVIYNKIKLNTSVKVNDWGPFDYHRDFNLTYPVQLMADISTQIGKPDWFILPGTKIGLRATWRSLDQFSPRYNPTQIIDVAGNLVPDPTALGFSDGQEWEIRTYIHINIGN
jgi:hypothetical protein